MNITEKVAYVRGLLEGLELDTNKKETKVLEAMMDLLDDMAFSISNFQEDFDELADQVEEIDEDLGFLEEDFYEDEDNCCEEPLFFEVTCPTCGETVCLSEKIILDGSIECPNCGEKLEFDLDDVCEGEGECECAPEENCENKKKETKGNKKKEK